MGKGIKLHVECAECNGTGLYRGMAEKDGAFVECLHCKGTGGVIVHHREFTGRKPRPECRRVYRAGSGICITDKDVVTDEGKHLRFSEWGVSYEEWEQGEKPGYIEELCCPMMADQGACHEKEGFTSVCNELHGQWLSYIPSCRYKYNMKKCWERFYNTKTKEDHES